MAEKYIKVTQVKSELGHVARNRGTIRALGLDRIGDTNLLPDNPAVRGMVRQVNFLVSVDELTGAEAATAATAVATKKAQKAKKPAKVKKAKVTKRSSMICSQHQGQRRSVFVSVAVLRLGAVRLPVTVRRARPHEAVGASQRGSKVARRQSIAVFQSCAASVMFCALKSPWSMLAAFSSGSTRAA